MAKAKDKPTKRKLGKQHLILPMLTSAKGADMESMIRAIKGRDSHDVQNVIQQGLG